MNPKATHCKIEKDREAAALIIHNLKAETMDLARYKVLSSKVGKANLL